VFKKRSPEFISRALKVRSILYPEDCETSLQSRDSVMLNLFQHPLDWFCNAVGNFEISSEQRRTDNVRTAAKSDTDEVIATQR
jgi:hypothetical protein